jgi:hypothetical protein
MLSLLSLLGRTSLLPHFGVLAPHSQRRGDGHLGTRGTYDVSCDEPTCGQDAISFSNVLDQLGPLYLDFHDRWKR